MRLACPAHRSARPDGDFVAGGVRVGGMPTGAAAIPPRHAAQTLSSLSNGATSRRRSSSSTGYVAPETLRAPVVRLVEAYRLEGGGATLTSDADRQTAARAAGPDQRWCPN